MSSWNGDPLPDPKEIAAYGDGEFEGQPQLASLRRRVEKWVESHPEAADQLQAQRRLTEVWQATEPQQPADAAWERAAAQVRELAWPALPAQHRMRAWRLAALGAACLTLAASVLWIVLSLVPPEAGNEIVQQPVPVPQKQVIQPVVPAAPLELLEVAVAEEVEILRVGGADTSTLVVGEPPVQGMMVIAQPGEVSVTRVEPAHDNMMPEVRGADPAGGINPMIWAPIVVK